MAHFFYNYGPAGSFWLSDLRAECGLGPALFLSRAGTYGLYLSLCQCQAAVCQSLSRLL